MEHEKEYNKVLNYLNYTKPKAYNEGYNDFNFGKYNNHYDNNSESYKLYERGYNDAKYFHDYKINPLI